MIALVFVGFVLLLGYLIGSSTINFVIRLSQTGGSSMPVYILPFVGIAELICLTQVLYLAFPTRIIGYIIWSLLLLLLVFEGKNIVTTLFCYVRIHKLPILFLIIIISLYAWPMIVDNELMSYQYSNNDIIYYLVTDDWMLDHSFFEEVAFSDNQPYYALADYILNINRTRFGTNVLESTLMSMLNIQSYQVFTLMGVVYIIGCITGLFYMMRRIFCINKFTGFALVLPLLIHSSWKEMLILQYIPQIAGVCFLQLFVIFLIESISNRNSESNIIVSLWLASTISTYAEYSSYLLLIFLGIHAIHIVVSKKIKSNLISVIKTGVIGLALNPLGTFVALRFNWETLMRVSDSTENIDAFSGNMKSLIDVFSQLFGGVDSNWNDLLHSMYSLTLAALAVIGIVILIVYFITNKKEVSLFFIWITALLLGYEIYFRISGIAYGEYKHLIGIAPLLLTCLIIFGFMIMRKKKITHIIFGLALCYITLLNLSSYLRDYRFDSICYYNDELVELSVALNQVPTEETVGLLGNTYYVQHEMIYPLKDRKIRLMGESYYTNICGVPLNIDVPKYIVIPSNYNYPYSYDVIWDNGRYKLATDIKDYKDYDLGTSYYHDDFNNLVVYGVSYSEENFAWTAGKQMRLVPLKIDSNDTDDWHEYYLKIDIDSVFNGSQELIACVNGKQVFDVIVSNSGVINIPFEVDSSELLNIELYFPDATSPLELGYSTDDRVLAFAMKEICISRTQQISIDEKIMLSGDGWNADEYIISGISGNEKYFTWSEGSELKFVSLEIDDVISELPVSLELELDIYCVFNGSQHLIIKNNGEIIFDEYISDAGKVDVEFTYIPSEDINISLEFPDAVSPEELGISTDSRELAIGFSTVSFKAA